ncbi:MAG: CHAT domain-containing protein [Cyanobacteria bacterium P01_A01_bin.137]
MKKILILAANPSDTTRLRLDQEYRDIQDGLERAQHRDNFELIYMSAVRPRDIQRALLNESPQIVHFSGHGEGEEGLVFQDDLGNSKLISSEALADLFELFASNIECVLLNGCYSKVQAESIVEHIEYVIGMQRAISDAAAIEFAVSFYDALGANRSYEFAYKLACNAIRLNASVSSQSSTRKLIPINDTRITTVGEHMIPVLLKRSHLFAVDQRVDQQIQTETKRVELEDSLHAVEDAANERLTVLNEKIDEEESKLQEIIEDHIKELLDWLKKNQMSLCNDAQAHTSLQLPNIFRDLSEQKREDFQWEIEKYIEAIYFSMLSDSFDLLDEPIVRPSVASFEAYQTAFEFIEKKIPPRLSQKARDLVFERFNYLLDRLFP